MKINILKKLIQKIINIKNQKQLLHSLKSGDLVWAKMPLPKSKLKTIEKTHQIRPYLIVKKDKKSIYAFQASSTNHKVLNNYQEYFINRLNYNQKRNSFINLTKVYKIPFINLKEKYITLKTQDIKNIQKRIKIQINRKYPIDINYQFPEDIRIVEGDLIIVNNQLYYVYADDNVYLYCIAVYKKYLQKGKIYTNISINKRTYYTNFEEKEVFNRNEKMEISNIASVDEREYILNKKKEIKYNLKKKRRLEKK